MFRNLLGASSKSEPPSQAPQPAPLSKGPTSDTILGVGTQLKGDLTASGHVRIEGTLVGDVTAQGRVALGEKATVEGDITGEAVIVSGVVRGDIVARSVSVLHTGRVWGDLRLERLATEEGGFMQGMVTMEERLDIAAFITQRDEQQAAAADEASEEVEPLDIDEESLPITARRSYRNYP